MKQREHGLALGQVLFRNNQPAIVPEKIEDKFGLIQNPGVGSAQTYAALVTTMCER